MRFQDPWFLILIPLALMALWFTKRTVKTPGLRFSNGNLLMGLPKSFRITLTHQIIILRELALLLILLALARPQLVAEESKIRTEGIDIALAVDVSSSMLAEDFIIGTSKVNRIEAAKTVIKDFVQGRNSDRIGIVAFAAQAFMICPLTLDHDWLLTNLERVKVGMIEDNTAIGSGLASAMNRLKVSGIKGKAVILLTDGRNNAGKITPEGATAMAKALKIKVYTIGLGSKGPAPFPVQDPFGKKNYRSISLDLDQDLLQWIATETEAKYFRAMDTTSLKEIFKEINRLEKAPIEEKVYQVRQELFPLFLVPGLILLVLEVTLRRTILRRIPYEI